MRKMLVSVLALFLISSVLIIPTASLGLNYSMRTDLSNVNASYLGDDENDRLGIKVAIVGDVNGDGYDDIAFGADMNDDGATNAGMAFLIFGNDTGWSMDTDLSNVDASFRGEGSGDRAGYSIAGPGDVNGDGYDDLLVGSPWNSEGGHERGQVYLFFGKTTGWTMNDSLHNADATFLGEKPDDWLGWDVAGAGDVNGDGYMDLLFSTKMNDDAGSNSGQTYLVLGKASGWTQDTSIADADASFWGESPEDHSGCAIAGAGDVNGDGYDDILIGAENAKGGNPWEKNAGRAYLFLGKSSGWAMDTSVSEADAFYHGEDANDLLGGSVAGAGDVNGDGYDDIMIGAYGDEEVHGQFTGQSYLIFGNSTGWSNMTNISARADASFIGENTEDRASAVAGAGDVNGDGYDDILIGAPGNTQGGGNFAGQTYLILGKASGWAMDTGLFTADASFMGENSWDISGSSLEGDGDVDGDGYDDLVIGASWNGEAATNAGQAYLIIPDHNTMPTSTTSVKAYSDASFTNTITQANVNDTVFVELSGVDGDGGNVNVATVQVTSNFSYPSGFRLVLRETATGSGTYRGNFTILNRTSEHHRWISALGGEDVTIRSTQDPTKSAVLDIVSPLGIFPMFEDLTVQEDAFYQQHFSTTGWNRWVTTTWALETDTDWLGLDSAIHNISGTPDNADVGTYHAKISVTNQFSYSCEHEFTITVNNTPPEIIGADVNTTLEDMNYDVDYNSTDDGAGAITWHLATDADWLEMNATTGILNGTPDNGDVGMWHVKVSVDDGNGGRDWSNFTLTVNNTNDAPVITSTDNLTAYEDVRYIWDYQVLEVDFGDNVTWHLDTNTGDWLTIQNSTGLLVGTPENDDVGSYWVNVSVTDENDGMDHHNFTLVVVNTNDAPEWTGVPGPSVMDQYGSYTFDVNATDVDVGDVLTYSVTTAPGSNMTINGTTGVLEWTPFVHGRYKVTVTVTDGTVSLTHDFTLQVRFVDLNVPPTAILVSPANGSETWVLDPQFKWTVSDKDGDNVTSDLYIATAIKSITDLDVKVLVGKNLTVTSFTPTTPLEKGRVYYWTVIPHDGKASGECTNGIWVLNVNKTARINLPPVLDTIPPQVAKVGKRFTLKVPGHDPNPEDGPRLVFGLGSGPVGMTIDPATGNITWTPGKDQVGTHQVRVRLSDGLVQVNTSFEITVKKAGPSEAGPMALLLPILLVLILVVVVVLVVLWLRRKTGKAVLEQGPGEGSRAQGEAKEESVEEGSEGPKEGV